MEQAARCIRLCIRTVHRSVHAEVYREDPQHRNAPSAHPQRRLQEQGGEWLSAAGIDLQIIGGLGLAFPELTPTDLAQLEQLLKLLWLDGVETIRQLFPGPSKTTRAYTLRENGIVAAATDRWRLMGAAKAAWCSRPPGRCCR